MTEPMTYDIEVKYKFLFYENKCITIRIVTDSAKRLMSLLYATGTLHDDEYIKSFWQKVFDESIGKNVGIVNNLPAGQVEFIFGIAKQMNLSIWGES